MGASICLVTLQEEDNVCSKTIVTKGIIQILVPKVLA